MPNGNGKKKPPEKAETYHKPTPSGAKARKQLGVVDPFTPKWSKEHYETLSHPALRKV